MFRQNAYLKAITSNECKPVLIAIEAYIGMHMQAIEKILWPTDSSDYAIGALKAAVVMANKFYAELHAFQVIEHIT